MNTGPDRPPGYANNLYANHLPCQHQVGDRVMVKVPNGIEGPGDIDAVTFAKGKVAYDVAMETETVRGIDSLFIEAMDSR